MARDYAIVTPAFWTGTTGRQLRSSGRDAQLLALYLMTNPHANMIGLYQLAVPTLCHEAGFTIEGATKALRSLRDEGFALYDDEAEEVWVVGMAWFQVTDRTGALDPKDKRCKGVARELLKFSKSKFYRAFLDRYATVFHLDASKAQPSPFEGPSKGLRSQEQEQEQEHDQEQEQDQKPAAAARGRAKRRPKLDPEAAEPASPPPAAEAVSESTTTPAREPEPSSEPTPEVPPTTTAVPPVGAIATDGNPTTPPASSQPAIPPARKPEAGRRANPGPVVDEIPRTPLHVIDCAGEEPGPLAAEFRQLAEEGIKHPLADPKPEKRASVFTWLERVIEAKGGPQRTAEWFVATELGRCGSGAPLTHSLTLVLAILESMPNPDEDPIERWRKACPPWAAMLEAIRNGPGGDELRPGQFERWILTLVPSEASAPGELVLVTEDKFHRSVIEDLYLRGLQRTADLVGGKRKVSVVVAAPASSAVGGAP